MVVNPLSPVAIFQIPSCAYKILQASMEDRIINKPINKTIQLDSMKLYRIFADLSCNKHLFQSQF